MVRARLRKHLENLRDRFPDALKDSAIVTSLDTDYRYRIIIRKAVWVKLVAEMANEQMYSNFKSEVAKNKEHVRSGYEHSLHDVWSVMYRLQSIAPADPIPRM